VAGPDRTMACNLLDESAGRLGPEALTYHVTLVLDMSVYRTLDEGIPSEVNVNDLSRRRDASGAIKEPAPKITLPPQPVFAENDSQFLRKAAPSNEPFPATFKWMAALPRNVRPVALLQRYPRIANIMARAWGDPVMFREYMFELLIDRRGGRQGFPENIRAELLRLRTYFDELNPSSRGIGPNVPE
jgi:hypothetical protein